MMQLCCVIYKKDSVTALPECQPMESSESWWRLHNTELSSPAAVSATTGEQDEGGLHGGTSMDTRIGDEQGSEVLMRKKISAE